MKWFGLRERPSLPFLTASFRSSIIRKLLFFISQIRPFGRHAGLLVRLGGWNRRTLFSCQKAICSHSRPRAASFAIRVFRSAPSRPIFYCSLRSRKLQFGPALSQIRNCIRNQNFITALHASAADALAGAETRHAKRGLAYCRHADPAFRWEPADRRSAHRRRRPRQQH